MTGIIQTKKGRLNYYAVLDAKDDGGKRVRKWVNTSVPIKGDNKRRATAKLQEILSKYAEGGIDITKDALFADYIVDWLETKKFTLAPTTYDAYKITLNLHILPYFEKKRFKIMDVTPAVIQQYVNCKLKTLSPNTVRKHLANISKCLDTAVKQNIIAYNPVKRIEMPKKVKFTGAKHYNERQIERLLECFKGDPLDGIILITLFYGLRRSEAIGLRWQAIDFGSKTLTIEHTVIRVNKEIHKQDRTKNDSSCTAFPMPYKIINELKRLQSLQQMLKSLQPNDYVDEGYVFTKSSGEVFSPEYVSKHFKLILDKNNLPPIRFHDLRHSSANYLKSLGFDLKDIQTWLRHKDIQTTMNLYVSLGMEAKSNIAESLNKKFMLMEV